MARVDRDALLRSRNASSVFLVVRRTVSGWFNTIKTVACMCAAAAGRADEAVMELCMHEAAEMIARLASRRDAGRVLASTGIRRRR